MLLLLLLVVVSVNSGRRRRRLLIYLPACAAARSTLGRTNALTRTNIFPSHTHTHCCRNEPQSAVHNVESTHNTHRPAASATAAAVLLRRPRRWRPKARPNKYLGMKITIPESRHGERRRHGTSERAAQRAAASLSELRAVSHSPRVESPLPRQSGGGRHKPHTLPFCSGARRRRRAKQHKGSFPFLAPRRPRPAPLRRVGRATRTEAPSCAGWEGDGPRRTRAQSIRGAVAEPPQTPPPAARGVTRHERGERGPHAGGKEERSCEIFWSRGEARPRAPRLLSPPSGAARDKRCSLFWSKIAGR